MRNVIFNKVVRPLFDAQIRDVHTQGFEWGIAVTTMEATSMDRDKVSAAAGKCRAAQMADSMRCARCGVQWDVNDPDPPVCSQRAEAAKRAEVTPPSPQGRKQNAFYRAFKNNVELMKQRIGGVK